MSELWEQFQKTGAVTDYLQYVAQKGNYDNQRSRPVTEAVR